MPTDKWGIPFLYPTKKTAGITGTGTGFFYQQSDNIMNDSHFSDEGHVSNSSGGTWTFKTSGPDAVQFAKNSCCSQTVIGGCGMNFANTAARGYAFKADDPRDVEIKFLIKFVNGGSNGFAIEGPTGAHSSSQCCSGNCYKIDMQYWKNPAIFRWRKEMWHVSNHTDPKTGEFSNSSFSNLLGSGNYIGLAYCRYNLKDGVSSGKDAVALEIWGNSNPTADITNWKLIKRTVDTGGWGDDGDVCNGAKDQIATWSSPKFRLKCNDPNGQFQIKNLSLREIDPTLSFDDVPSGGTGEEGPTTTTEVIGSLTIKRDVNSLRTSACSGAGSSSGSIFYDSPLDGSGNDWAFPHGVEPQKTRIGMKAHTSSSTLLNRPSVKQVDLYMKKTGSPTGTATCKIRSSGNPPTDKATIATLDVSTLTGTSTLTSFINTSNTYIMVTGDKLIVEYTSGDASNYVSIKVNESLQVTNGVYTKATYFDNTTQSWTESSTHELAGRVWG